MRLVFIGGVDLLDGVEGLGLEVKAFPHLGKTTPSQLLAAEVAVDECFVLENGVIVCAFEYRLLIGLLNRRIFICLGFVPNPALIGLALSPVSAHRVESQMVVGGVIAASFVQTVAFEQFALALVVQLVLLEVGIIVRLATLAPLVLALLARGKFQVAQLLNVYVEVHRPLLLLAVVQGRLSRKRAAIVGVGN
jgi:hypothetical protein